MTGKKGITTRGVRLAIVMLLFFSANKIRLKRIFLFIAKQKALLITSKASKSSAYYEQSE